MNRHRTMMILLIALVMVTVIAVVATSVLIFNRTTRENRAEILTNAARLAAGHIDGDKVDGWLRNGKDEDYETTAAILESILRNTPHLEYLYVYQILPDGCHVVFDFDTPDTAAGEFRELVPFDESFEDQIPTLLAGGKIDTMESRDTYGWLLTAYEPVYDSAGKCVCYVGADLSMQGVYDYVQGYFFRVAIIAAVFLIGCILIGMRLLTGVRRADAMDNLIAQQKRDKELTREIIEAFAKVVDMKDKYTQGHSSRVAKYTEMLARELGCDEDEIEKYYNIALMHDIGKVAVPDSVLNKPGKLTDDEFELIKSHTARGYDVLETISIMPEIAIGARSHHERPDGKGYPQGLKGEDLPLVARIIGVADCFDAMYSNRPYRNRMNFDRVVEIIKNASGTQLSPEVVDAFLRLVDKGEFRAPDDHGGGTTENIENIRGDQPKAGS
jgi:putative nucleotidyltransferase with HDIG domain